MDEKFENLKGLEECLLQDVFRYYGRLEESTAPDDFEFWARGTTRAVFAAIGGLCECLCAMAFITEINKLPGGTISPGKLSVLAGETYIVDDNGKIRAQPIRIRFANQVLFSLNAFSEAHDLAYRVKKDTPGWKDFKAAIVIRDSITHPKDTKALLLTKPDMAVVKGAFVWFHTELAEILRAKGIDIPPMPPMP